MVALFELGAKRAAEAIRNGEQTAEALAEALLARCAAASPLNAFISLEADRCRHGAALDHLDGMHACVSGPLRALRRNARFRYNYI